MNTWVRNQDLEVLLPYISAGLAITPTCFEWVERQFFYIIIMYIRNEYLVLRVVAFLLHNVSTSLTIRLEFLCGSATLFSRRETVYAFPITEYFATRYTV